jgi:branched-chain amino acid transport system permease protein
MTELPPYRVARSSRWHLIPLAIGIVILVVLALQPTSFGASYLSFGVVPHDLITFLTLLALAQLWNLLGGFAGLISVGQQAYVGVGAYGLWLLGDVLHINPFVAVILAGFLAVIVAGPVAPLLFRLRGGYFAIGTWVVAEVMRLIVSNIQSTGGGSGKTVVSAAKVVMTHGFAGIYWLSLGVAVVTIVAVFFLLRSRLGLALTSIRDNDIAAQSSGVNVFRAKMLVYIIAAFGSGVIGALVAFQLLRIQPAAAFSVVNWTAYPLVIVVIGGFGSIEGPIIGAVIYFVLLQTLSQYGSWYMLLLGALAVLFATVAPRGIWGWIDKRWHVHVFPVRRRLVVEAQPAEAEKKKATAGAQPSTESL